MNRFKIPSFFVAIVSLSLVFLPGAEARIVGKTYYVFFVDIVDMSFDTFLMRFEKPDSDNASSADNATEGRLHITVQATTFDNETGAYSVNGILFNGTWEAAKKEYSSFYQDDIYTYYSFLLYGIAFYRGAYIAGVIYSDTLVKCTAKDTEEITRILPFFGVATPLPSG